MSVTEIMSCKIVSVSPDDTLRIVSDVMELGSVRHLPVVCQGRLVGVVSQRDLLRASLSNIMRLGSDEQSYFLEGVEISEVMSSPAISIPGSASVQAAAGLMADRKIGCLPVVEGDEFVGLVTETDVLRYFANVQRGSEGTA